GLLLELVGLQTIRYAKILYPVMRPVPPADSLVGADPYETGRIFDDAKNDIVRQVILGCIGRPPVRVYFKPAQALGRTDPQRPIPALQDIIDIVTTNAVRVGRMPVMRKGPGQRIE